MPLDRRQLLSLMLSSAATLVVAPAAAQVRGRRPANVDLSPARWQAGEYQRLMAAQGVDRTAAGSAMGNRGAVTVAYNGLAARAGLEALKQGGNAIDALMATAMAQVVLTAGSPISFFGIMSLVYYEARTGRTHTMNAEWNTVRGETDPTTIPGSISFASNEALRGRGAPSGRTALVGGFLKGVGAAHQRFGRLPFAKIFDPAIYMAEEGMPVTGMLSGQFEMRKADLARLPETRATFLKPDGSTYQTGETFRQPALAATLRHVAEEGTDYIYRGAWARKLVAAVQADGGRMTLDDLNRYEVIWGEPLTASIGDGYTIRTNPWPNAGGVALIEAQNLARAAGLTQGTHFTGSGEALRNALDICAQGNSAYLPPSVLQTLYPNMDLSPEARVTQAHAEAMWTRMQAGAKLSNFRRTAPQHSDDVVVIDGEGNIAAITHSINCVFWGKTAICVDGITIGDPASFQQAQIARLTPGDRLPAPTETGILFKDNRPMLGFASMGAGLHQRTFQCLLNVTSFGMDVEEAINTADFYLPSYGEDGQMTVGVPVGRFDHDVLNATGYAWREVSMNEARLGGEGKWVAISRNPETRLLHAASHNRNNSDAFAF